MPPIRSERTDRVLQVTTQVARGALSRSNLGWVAMITILMRATCGVGGWMQTDMSPWWAYINHPDVYDESSSAGKSFREQFRLPPR